MALKLIMRPFSVTLRAFCAQPEGFVLNPRGACEALRGPCVLAFHSQCRTKTWYRLLTSIDATIIHIPLLCPRLAAAAFELAPRKAVSFLLPFGCVRLGAMHLLMPAADSLDALTKQHMQQQWCFNGHLWGSCSRLQTFRNMLSSHGVYCACQWRR